MSGLVYHQRKLKVNTLQIGNQKKKLITRKKKYFPYQSQCIVQFTKRKLGANEVHKIGDMKSLVWGGGEGVGEGVGKGGGNGEGKGVVYIPDLLLVILCKYEITFFQLETTTG